MEFRNLGLSEHTLQALDKLGYVEPTEVQEKVIPEIINGTNLLVRSHTGTGKTAAFGVGIIERIAAGKSRKALIMCPTRELAVQVCKELRSIAEFQNLKIHVIYGGASINVQVDDLRGGVDILIATPGRLLDLSQRGIVRIGDFDIGILDEADQMLDMGFIDDVTTIMNQLPKQRMTLLISATIDESIMSIARKYVSNPKTVEVGEIEKAATITEEHIEATDLEKFPKLIDVLRSHPEMKILVFRETKMGASRLQERLWQRGFKAGVLQGDMSQAQRNRTLADFKEGKLHILVATNVAGRGLHIENLGLVINYDRAQSEEVHLHRIGRTGRMGQEGKAINFHKRKETLQERMSEEHPDFAWMKQGGLDSYRSDERRPRRHGAGGHGGGYRGGEHRGRPGGHVGGGQGPYRSEGRRGHGGARPGGHGGGDNPYRSDNQEGRGDRGRPYEGRRREGGHERRGPPRHEGRRPPREGGYSGHREGHPRRQNQPGENGEYYGRGSAAIKAHHEKGHESAGHDKEHAPAHEGHGEHPHKKREHHEEK